MSTNPSNREWKKQGLRRREADAGGREADGMEIGATVEEVVEDAIAARVGECDPDLG